MPVKTQKAKKKQKWDKGSEEVKLHINQRDYGNKRKI